jgi:hypothetical protein
MLILFLQQLIFHVQKSRIHIVSMSCAQGALQKRIEHTGLIFSIKALGTPLNKEIRSQYGHNNSK